MHEYAAETGRYGVLITGDRRWRWANSIKDRIKQLHREHPSLLIIEGGAPGCDDAVRGVVNALGLEVHTDPAHWRHQDPRWVRWNEPCSPR